MGGRGGSLIIDFTQQPANVVRDFSQSDQTAGAGTAPTSEAGRALRAAINEKVDLGRFADVLNDINS